MIYDKLEHMKQYLGCHPNLDTAIRYLTAHDLSALPTGITEIDGSNVYLNVMTACTEPENRKSYEIHKNYMDIQIDIEGTEVILTGDSDGLRIEDYDPSTDFGRASCSMLASCLIGPGNFIVCMAMEPHKPGVSAGPDSSCLRKCVVKVHI